MFVAILRMSTQLVYGLGSTYVLVALNVEMVPLYREGVLHLTFCGLVVLRLKYPWSVLVRGML